jgi:hypothetical protein
MNRRQLLKWLGGAAGVGLAGRFALLPPSPSRRKESAHTLAVQLFEALDVEARKNACVAYDHPLRQYHNRGVWGGGLQINPHSLGWEERSILTDLFYAGLSEAGQERVPNEFFAKWPGVHSMKLLFCGDPKEPPYQVILTGAHLNLRIGGKCREEVAFGGPLVYGDQRGDAQQGLPGNLYRSQFQASHRLFSSLRPEERQIAIQEKAPIQTQIELRGSQGEFAGVSIERLSKESRALARELVDEILGNYPAEDVAYARECLEHNGGVDGLFLSYYREGEVGGSGQYQIFRLEGPAAVFYFRGYPHVHAFINVAMNGDAPLSVGELIGTNAEPLEGDAVKRLFEDAMRAETGADLAYYDREAVVGRLRAGPIRQGDIYNLESWQDSISVFEVKGSSFRPPFVAELRARYEIDPDPRKVYTIATPGDGEWLGEMEASRESVMLRDATIAHLKKRT